MPAAKPKTQKMYRANTSFAVDLKGNPGFVVRQGDLFAEGEPILKQVPDFFDEAEDVVRSTVEQATAAPGESRG
jgi:hypothetical protein